MTETVFAEPQRTGTWSIVLSVLMIVAGFLAIFAPFLAGITLTAIVGWLLVVSGILHLAFAWRAGHASAVVWELLVGIVYGGAGLFLLSRPVAGLVSLTIGLSIYLLLESALEFVLAFRMRPLPGSGWLVFDGIVTFVLAAMIWATWPSSAIWVVGTLVGVSMMFSGFTRLMLSLAHRRIAA